MRGNIKSSILNSKLSIIKGFTLIELLVVISIIAILAGLLLSNNVGVRQRSRDGVRKSDLNQILSALELYRSDLGYYPVSLGACGGQINNGPTIYMKKIPCDPISSSTPYTYASTNASGGVCDNTPSNICISYIIYACLENTSDPQKDSSPKPGCTTSFTLTNP